MFDENRMHYRCLQFFTSRVYDGSQFAGEVIKDEVDFTRFCRDVILRVNRTLHNRNEILLTKPERAEVNALHVIQSMCTQLNDNISFHLFAAKTSASFATEDEACSTNSNPESG